MEKQYKEIFAVAPWGKIALVVWGNTSLEPVLLVHGRLDSAATFQPLVQHLPKTHCYVGVDMPGNGKSDPFPKGLTVSRYHLIPVIDVVVRHMRWKTFVFIGHSMGCEVGLFYNAIWPGVVKGFVHIDAIPSLQRLQQPSFPEYYSHYYERFYGNYNRYFWSPRQYTKKQAIEAIMKARGVSEEEAEILLSRVLIPTQGNKYILSWDPRMKYIIPQNATNDYYLDLFTKNIPPSLLITMSEGSAGVKRGLKAAKELVQDMKSRSDLKEIFLEGGHDYHVTDPGAVAEYVTGYLNKSLVKSKI